MSAAMPAVARLHEDELVGHPRATRKAALFVLLALVVLPFVFLIAPWRQSVAARGRVVAYDPIDRVQTILSPVDGRVIRNFVQEGSRVEAGAPLLELADLDPSYALRLEQQSLLAQEKLRAARESVTLLAAQVESLTESRDLAVAVARLELNVAREDVRAAEQSLVGEQADRDQKVADQKRKERLFGKEIKLTSELSLQKAVADAAAATAKVEESRAKLKMAREKEGAKAAYIDKTRAEHQAKLDDVASKVEEAKGKVAIAEKDLQEALTKVSRQSAQRIVAPRAGVVLDIAGAAQSQLVKKDAPLIRLVPDTDRLAVELWLSGNDAPLVGVGRQVRLQFEGWPAVQFVGWPSVAQGTFGGTVSVVDPHGDGKGKFRILVEPDENDDPWPERRFLRQGVAAKGWVLLDEVSLGFEVWRQLNGFPPSLDTPPSAGGDPAGGKSK